MTSYYKKFEIDDNVKRYLDAGIKGPVESALTTMVCHYSQLHMLQHIIGLCTDMWIYSDVCRLVALNPIEVLCDKFTALPQNGDRLDFAMSLASHMSGNSSVMGVYLAAVSCKKSKYYAAIDIESADIDDCDADYIQSEDIDCEVVDCDEEIEGFDEDMETLDVYYVKEGDALIPHVDLDVHDRVEVDINELLTDLNPVTAPSHVFTNGMGLKKITSCHDEGILAACMSEYLTPQDSQHLPVVSKSFKDLFNKTSHYLNIIAFKSDLVHCHSVGDIHAATIGRQPLRTLCGPVAGLSIGGLTMSQASLLPFNKRGKLAAKLFKDKMNSSISVPAVDGHLLPRSSHLNVWIFNYHAGVVSSPFDAVPPRSSQRIRTPGYYYVGPKYLGTFFYPIYSSYRLRVMMPQQSPIGDTGGSMHHKVNVVSFKYHTAAVIVRMTKDRMDWSSYGVTIERILAVADNDTYSRLYYHRAARYCRDPTTRLAAENLEQEVLLRFLISYMKTGRVNTVDESVVVSRERYSNLDIIVNLVNATRLNINGWHRFLTDKEYLAWLEDVVRPFNILECHHHGQLIIVKDEDEEDMAKFMLDSLDKSSYTIVKLQDQKAATTSNMTATMQAQLLLFARANGIEGELLNQIARDAYWSDDDDMEQ